MPELYSVAIDGPSGAGKSTVAKAVAKELGFSCLDTGAMYRAIAWRALQDGVALDDESALGVIARTYDIAFGHVEGDPVPRRVFIGDDEVTDAIRTAEIDRAVSPVSAAGPPFTNRPVGLTRSRVPAMCRPVFLYLSHPYFSQTGSITFSRSIL